MKVELKVVGGSRSGQSIPISVPQFMIGRAEDCHLKPRSELISRYHCAILSEDGYVGVRDLGSKNGVYVNGERIGVERELKNGDRLVIGPLEFEVSLTVALKGETKSRVETISEVVARTVEQSSINARREAAKAAASAPAPAPAPEPKPAPAPAPAPKPEPAPAPAPAPKPEPAPAPAPAPKPEPAPTPAPEPKPAPKAAPASAAAFFSAPIGAKSSSDSEDGDLADWLLGDDEDGGDDETQTLTMEAAEDLDLPYTPKEEEEKPEEKKPAESGPNTSDAAANLLKNFFKGGR